MLCGACGALIVEFNHVICHAKIRVLKCVASSRRDLAKFFNLGNLGSRRSTRSRFDENSLRTRHTHFNTESVMEPDNGENGSCCCTENTTLTKIEEVTPELSTRGTEEPVSTVADGKDLQDINIGNVSAVIAEKAHRGGEEGTEGGMANDADDVDDGVKERRGQIPNKPEENGDCVCCH